MGRKQAEPSRIFLPRVLLRYLCKLSYYDQRAVKWGYLYVI